MYDSPTSQEDQEKARRDADERASPLKFKCQSAVDRYCAKVGTLMGL
jgi:hypothetical protein